MEAINDPFESFIGMATADSLKASLVRAKSPKANSIEKYQRKKNSLLEQEKRKENLKKELERIMDEGCKSCDLLQQNNQNTR